MGIKRDGEVPLEMQLVYRLGNMMYLPHYSKYGHFALPGEIGKDAATITAATLKEMGAKPDMYPLMLRASY